MSYQILGEKTEELSRTRQWPGKPNRDFSFSSFTGGQLSYV